MRRAISIVSAVITLGVLGVILWTATMVDRRPPSVERVSLSAPAGGERIAQTLTAIDIEFSERVDRGSVERRFRVDPYVAGSIAWDGSTAIFTPSDRLPPSTRLTVTIEPGFTDLVGNAAPAGLEAWTFTTVGPPAVVESSPGDGATGLGVDGSLAIRFDRLMDTRAVEEAIRIDPVVALRFGWSGDRLTVGFEQPLRFGTAYTLTLGSQAADTAGNPIQAPYAFRFTTVSAGLGVATTVPAGGVPGISVRSTIAVVFDAPIDPHTVVGAIRITPNVFGEARVVAAPDDTTTRPGNPGPGRVLLFTPSSPLAANTTYTVTLAPVVARADDPVRVAAGRTWTFTTGAPTVSAQNQVAFLSTRAGVRNVWLMNPDGSNPRQLTTELAPVTGFDFPGDGSWVTFAAGGLVSTMKVDGTDRRRLTADDAFEYAPRVTPDGRWILVGRRSGAGADLGWWLAPVSLIVGPERRVLGAGAPPLGSVALLGDGAVGGDGLSTWAGRAAFDPGGRWLLLVTGGGDVVRIDLGTTGGSAPVATATGLVAEGAPVWLASQARFWIVAREAGRQGSTVWSVDTAGRSDTGVAASGSLDVASDGTLALLLRSGAGAAARLALLAPGGAAASTLATGGPAVDDRWPAFSPDGGTILFSRVAASGSGASAGIWTVDRIGREPDQVATDGAEPRWIP